MPKFLYHPDGSLPNDGEVFVFGSNLSGIHGAGAARAALNFGARFGREVGLAGRSYAIPTKDKSINHTLSINIIRKYVNEFVIFTHHNKEKKFFLTRIGCGLAGLQDSEIAPMFMLCYNNCNMPDVWEQYLK